jgi:hypothetical protein
LFAIYGYAGSSSHLLAMASVFLGGGGGGGREGRRALALEKVGTRRSGRVLSGGRGALRFVFYY